MIQYIDFLLNTMGLKQIFFWSIPVLGMAIVIGIPAYSSWRQNYLARPAYDELNAEPTSGMRITASSWESSPQSEYWQLIEVISGDSFKARNGWRQETIRLCGINAIKEPSGEKAKQYLQQLLGLNQGEVIVVPLGRDRRNRLVAEIFVNARNPKMPEEEKFVNGEMVRAGWAEEERRFSCPNPVSASG